MANGSSNLIIPGVVGDLEAVLQLPQATQFTQIGIVCHPHPLQGGNMNNKVVTTVAKTFNQLGMAALRFNYRGIGNSAGSFGDVSGEAEDCLAVIAWARQQWPDVELSLAGFSFGSYIAAYAATQVPTKELISIAPPIERMPFTKLAPITCPWLVIQGADDEVVDPQGVYDWFDRLQADKRLVKIPGTGHFFHGKLAELRNAILKNEQP